MKEYVIHRLDRREALVGLLATGLIGLPDQPAEASEPSVQALLRHLQAECVEERQQAADGLRKLMRDVVRCLTATIAAQPAAGETVPDSSGRTLAVDLLADIVAVDTGLGACITLLIERIDYVGTHVAFDDSLIGGYSCAVALARIGPSAIPYMLDYLITHPPEDVEEETIRLHADTLLSMPPFGPTDRQDSLIPLLRSVASETDQNENIKRVLKHIVDYLSRRA